MNIRTILSAASLVLLFSCASSSDGGPKAEASDTKKIAPRSRSLAPTPKAVVNANSFKAKKYIEIILDASGSMGEEIEGELKIETAKNMIGLITKTLQEDQAAVSLTAFGHRKSWSCKDIELIYDLGFKTSEEIDKRIEPLKPAERGKTPIAESLLRAYRRLKNVKGPKGIFVITDGAETCGGDPCKVALMLRKQLDVQVYTLTYKPKSIAEFKSLACLGGAELAKDKDDVLKKMAKLKDMFDADYARKMEGLETVQSLKVLGPIQDAWATAKASDGKEFRFLAAIGTTLPVGNFEVTVHYNPPVTFIDVPIKESERKTLTVVGEGSLMLEYDFPGVELDAVNLVDSKKYRVIAGKEARVPVGRYNVSGMTASGLAFQWQNQTVTPEAAVKLSLPNWALLELRTDKPITFDLFPYGGPEAIKKMARGSYSSNTGSVKRYKDSLGFFPTNAPHVVEAGEYSIILSDGRVIDRIQLGKGESKVELIR